MRQIEESGKFRKDKRRLKRSGMYGEAVKKRFAVAVARLANDMTLDISYRDHQLYGEWEGCRECHIRPDLLLVYQYVGNDWLILERFSSHADIFGL